MNDLADRIERKLYALMVAEAERALNAYGDDGTIIGQVLLGSSAAVARFYWRITAPHKRDPEALLKLHARGMRLLLVALAQEDRASQITDRPH